MDQQLISYNKDNNINNNNNNDNNKDNNINTNNGNNNKDNSIPFFKIWRNIIIKKEISLYIRHHTKELNDLNSFNNFSKKRYVVKLIINGCYDYGASDAILEYVNVEYLKLGNRYKKYTIRVPPNVKTVEIGDYFNQPLVVRDIQTDRFTYSIPEGVEKLIFGVLFNDPIFYGELPKSLKCIKFHKHSTHNRVLVTPRNLAHLKLGRSYNVKIGINNLELSQSITNLNLGSNFNGAIKEADGKKLLPDGLKKLNLGSFNQQLLKGDIPKTVVKLVFTKYNKPLIPYESIPFSVTYLDLGYNFRQVLLPGSIPTFVKTLIIRAPFYQDTLDSILPAGLENLHLPYKYSNSNSIESIKEMLPNLKELKFAKLRDEKLREVKEKVETVVASSSSVENTKKRINRSIISEFNLTILISILLFIITILISNYFY